MRHGVYRERVKGEVVYDFYWMGEGVCESDFNERLQDQTRSVSKDVDMIQMGMDLKENINEGQKTVAQLNELEKIAKLPLCEACRKLIGEVKE